MCSDAANGDYEDFKDKNQMALSREGEATTSQSRIHLSDVLEMLIKLDQQGIFMNPVDDSVAPDYYKIIKNPMCFLKMKEKVHSQEYASWSSFVEDFENICHNAMKYNQKRSKIWNAANSLLRQGKRCLDQQKHKNILGFLKIAKDVSNSLENQSSARVEAEKGCEGRSSNGSPDRLRRPDREGSADRIQKDPSKQLGKAELDGSVNLFSNGHSSPPDSNEKDILNKTTIKSEVAEMGMGVKYSTQKNIGSSPKSCEPGLKEEEVFVEVLDLLPDEDVRHNSDEQATECSSSFGDSQTEDESYLMEMSEVESYLREGNGATTPSEDTLPPARRKKRPLNLDWKNYRQGIEWRCRWLELRIKELQAESLKYDKILAKSKKRKEQNLEQQEDYPGARTIVYNNKNRVLKRRRRRKAEESTELKLYMARHPVFSRYEKKKQRNQELSTEDVIKDESHQMLEIDDFNTNFEDEFEDNIIVEEDSMEQYLWHIEALQMHLWKLKNQLARGTQGYRNATKSSPSPGGLGHVSLSGSPRPLNPRSLLGASKAHGGSIARRRNSDFDINNVIMPDNAMVNYIEPAKHAFIETPHWRVLEDVPGSDGGSSSEDTDDEAYRRRHGEMQVKERLQHYAPLNKSQKSTPSGKGNLKHGSGGKERVVRTAVDGDADEDADFPTTFSFIPKRKRRKRESRDVALIAKNIEPLLSAPQTVVPVQDCKMTETTTDGDHFQN